MNEYPDEHYARVMMRLWEHPSNDQRFAVREWLRHQKEHYANVVDIGCGDAYYLDIIKPQSYVAIEPNEILGRKCAERAHEWAISLRSYSSVLEAVNHLQGVTFETKLLLHSLFYLSIEEARVTLTAIPAERCLIVHPLISSSSTVNFEASIGIHTASELVQLKEQLLGKPATHEVAKTHLCFDAATTSNEELAFVVAHRALRFGDQGFIMKRALELINKMRQQWTIDGVVKIPQWQVMQLFVSSTP